MKVFKDNAEREWTIDITVDVIRRVRALLGLDLLDVAGGDLLKRLIGDPVLLCDVLYVICKPAADAQEISDEDFGRAMAGDAIAAATSAMLEGLADFFPSPRRELFRKAINKIGELEQLAMKAADEALDSPRMTEHIQTIFAEIDPELPSPKRSGESSGSSPESSDATPAP